MESLAEPIRRLDDDAAWFARATELSLLHVTCSASLRGVALKTLVGAIEFHPDNRSPVIVLEDSWTLADSGWKTRAQRMVEHWEGRVRVLAEEGIELGSLSGQRPASPDAFGAFGGWLNLVLQAVRPPLQGLVVVLAPARIEDASAFEQEVFELVRTEQLSGARWVVVDMEEAALPDLHAELAAKALRCHCVRDETAFARDLNTLMTSVDPELPGPARAGAAWPRRVMPPRRPGEPMPPTAEQQAAVDKTLEEAGVSPGLAGPEGSRMQQYMTAGAIHMKHGNVAAAVDCQATALKIALESGARRESLLQQLVLAGYRLAAGDEVAATAEFLAAGERAIQWGFPLEEAQAHLAVAVIEAKAGRHPEAARHYGLAADAARRAEATGLAIESWRLAGQMAAAAKLEERASECFGRAIELAEDSEPEVAKTSSAPEAARQLAATLRANGLSDQANSLELTANRLEEGMPRSAEELL